MGWRQGWGWLGAKEEKKQDLSYASHYPSFTLPGEALSYSVLGPEREPERDLCFLGSLSKQVNPVKLEVA